MDKAAPSISQLYLNWKKVGLFLALKAYLTSFLVPLTVGKVGFCGSKGHTKARSFPMSRAVQHRHVGTERLG